MSTARHRISRTLDAYLLRDTERVAAARSPSQQDEIERYFDAAKKRIVAADLLVEPGDALGATILYRDAAVCLIASLAKANDAHAALPRTAVEAWQTFDLLALSRKDAQPAALNEVRSVLEDGDPLAFDRLAQDDLVRVRTATREVVSWLRARVDPRPVPLLRATRRLRIGVGVFAGAMVIYFSLSTLLSSPNVARGKPTTASSQYPGTPIAAGATNGQIESSYGVHTNVEDEPWVRVDLEKPYAVSEVRVYNRGDAYIDEGLPIALEFSLDAITWTEIDRRTTPYTQAHPWIAKPHRVRTRYVRLKIPRHGYIAISEIEVFA
ncbi:MAG TPA: discoidin domain-containing protein [Polyangiaceae bacterium]|nr:discoidin domain-containing protein [Polyangiaceae bacterium]